MLNQNKSQNKLLNFFLLGAYGIFGFASLSYFSYKATKNSFIKVQSFFDDNGKRKIGVPKQVKSAFMKGSIFFVVYSIGFWQLMNYLDVVKGNNLEKLILTPEMKKNKDFQNSYILDQLRYFKVSQKLIAKTESQLEHITQNQNQ